MPEKLAAERHPAEGVLRSYLDGELGWIAAFRLGWHVRRCSLCSGRLAEQRRLGRRAAELLGRLTVPVDTAEAWRSLRERERAGAARARPSLSWRAATAAGAALALGALALLTVRPDGRRSGQGEATRIRDLCCWDLDGGGPGDDGVLTVTLAGERVLALALYEDRNGSGSLTTRDPIRFASLPAVPTSGLARERGKSAARAEGGTVVRDLCCADYDGGGPADDGVFAVSRPGEVVDAVILYEDLDGTRSLSPADRLRWGGELENAPAIPREWEEP